MTYQVALPTRRHRIAEAMFEGHRARNLIRAQRGGFAVEWPQWSDLEEDVRRGWLEYADDALSVIDDKSEG